MRIICAALLLLLIYRPALAEFATAQAAERRGEYSEAYQSCKSEAEAGDPECQNLVGYLFQQGLGVPPNATESIRLFRLAAVRGLASAQNNLGFAYEQGLNLSPDDAQAARWYQLSASQGDPVGVYRLAKLLATGRGIAQDRQRSAELLRHAADRGYATAQITLALALETARPARRAFLAYIWYRIAARVTRDPAIRDQAALGQDRLLVEFSSQEIILARNAADSWKPLGPQLEFGPLGARPAANSSPASRKPASSGSGFFVSHDGDLITANHVVEGCRELRVVRDEKSNAAHVIGTDAGADLAILKVTDTAGDIANFRPSDLERPGESVIVAGFPLQGLLTSKASVTTGIISALAGPNEDKKLFQITAPVQPGNSGGPLVDNQGSVVGIVVSKLNSLRVARATGAIPENTNFTVKADLARALLDKHGIKYDVSASNVELTTPEIAERVFRFIAMVQCYR